MEQQDAKLIKQRQRKKKMKYGGIAFAITVIVTAIVILVNVVVGLLVDVACQAKRKKVTRKTQKTALIHPIYGNQSGFSYVI